MKINYKSHLNSLWGQTFKKQSSNDQQLLYGIIHLNELLLPFQFYNEKKRKQLRCICVVKKNIWTKLTLAYDLVRVWTHRISDSEIIYT